MKKYYKVLTKDLRAPNNNNFSYKDWENKIFEVKGKLEWCRNGLHLYKSLNNLSVGNFGSRVFEAKLIGKFLEDASKLCCKKIKIIKEIDIMKIEDDYWIYHYCQDVKDRSELWKKLKEDQWIYNYCIHVQDRSELWKKLKDDEWIYRYCKDMKDRSELWKKLTEGEWIFYYCRDIQDRSELWKKLKKDNGWIPLYLRYVKDRPELREKLKEK